LSDIGSKANKLAQRCHEVDGETEFKQRSFFESQIEPAMESLIRQSKLRIDSASRLYSVFSVSFFIVKDVDRYGIVHIVPVAKSSLDVSIFRGGEHPIHFYLASSNPGQFRRGLYENGTKPLKCVFVAMGISLPFSRNFSQIQDAEPNSRHRAFDISDGGGVRGSGIGFVLYRSRHPMLPESVDVTRYYGVIVEEDDEVDIALMCQAMSIAKRMESSPPMNRVVSFGPEWPCPCVKD